MTNRARVGGWLLVSAIVTATASPARAERLPLRTYTTEHGLPNDKVWRIRSDSRGFLWFATSGGLARFDGSRFEVYGAREGLTASIIDLIEARGGGYWLATNGQGVVRFHTDRKAGGPRFTVYRVGVEPRVNYVNTVFEDRFGRIWAGTDSGLAVLDPAHPSFERVSLALTDYDDRSIQVWSIHESRDGALWIGTTIGLVLRLPDGRTLRQSPAKPAESSTVFTVARDRAGRMWIAGTFGVEVLADDSAALRPVRRFTAPEIPGAVRALAESRDGTMWASSGSSLLEIRGDVVRGFGGRHGLPHEQLSALAQDVAGNVWIGSMGRGAARLAADGFVSFDEQDGLGSRGAGTILTDREGGVVVATANYFVNRFDGRRFHTVPLSVPGGAGSDRRHMIRDHLGDWWTVSSGGIFRIHAVARLEDLAHIAPHAIYTSRSGLASDDCMRLREDSRGDVWIGYRLPGRQVLTRWERATNTFHHYSDADGLPAYAPVRDIVEDRSGAVWVAFWEGGLARYRHGRFVRMTEARGVPETGLAALYVDRAGRVWFGSSDRIGRIDDPDADQPTVSHTIPGPFVCNGPQTIVEDDSGRLYFGGVNGVDRLDPRSGAMRHFSTMDGLASNEVVAAMHHPDGALWFTTTGGVSRLQLSPDRHPQPVSTLVKAIVAGNYTVPLSDLGDRDVAGLTVGPRFNQLRIEFAGLSFSAGEPLRYRYKLEGADGQWSAPSIDRSVQYANLSPGRYRFVVESLAFESVPQAQPATVSFTVLAPMWRRWWFVALAAIAAALVLAAFHRARVRRLLAVERIRTGIASDLHDELGSSLSRIAILSEVVKGDLTAPTRDTVRRIEQIAATARDLLSSTHDLIWSIHPRRDNVKGLVTRVRSFAAEILEGRGIAWIVRMEPEVETVDLSAERRWHLLLILKEAINNVVRHAGARHVRLMVHCEHGTLIVALRDDGRGFAAGSPQPNGEAPGYGLRNMQVRAQEIGAQLQIDSNAGAGTSVTVRLPL